MLKPRSPQESFYGSYLYDRIVPQDHKPLAKSRRTQKRRGEKFFTPTSH